MEDRCCFWNPLRIMSSRLHSEIGGEENLYEMPVSEDYSPEEHLVLMISKLIEMAKALPVCVKTGDPAKIQICERLGGEVHRHEKLATSALVKSPASKTQNVFRIVVRFPGYVGRIGIMLENVVNCSRTKIEHKVPFSKGSQAEVSTISSLLQDMLENLRDVLVIPNKILLQYIRSQGNELAEIVEDARSSHWERLEAGLCTAHASLLYLEILDSFGGVGEYANKMCDGITVLAETTPEFAQDVEKSEP